MYRETFPNFRNTLAETVSKLDDGRIPNVSILVGALSIGGRVT